MYEFLLLDRCLPSFPDGNDILPICQGNDGTRWYYYGYELDSQLLQMYGGGTGSEENPYTSTTAATAAPSRRSAAAWPPRCPPTTAR